jgi:hypothetical protein
MATGDLANCVIRTRSIEGGATSANFRNVSPDPPPNVKDCVLEFDLMGNLEMKSDGEYLWSVQAPRPGLRGPFNLHIENNGTVVLVDGNNSAYVSIVPSTVRMPGRDSIFVD